MLISSLLNRAGRSVSHLFNCNSLYLIAFSRQMASVTKKFINDPVRAVDDALNGLVNGSDQITFDKSCHRVTLRADYADYCAKGMVSLIAGGGSGHEPYAAGKVWYRSLLVEDLATNHMQQVVFA
ncbi:hypothetical protein Q1695_002857 [Nippostrongylus brasiliensis]|nr:hypothetical protein Q1695_002857 [Nippostrongylus brasiliensis]